MSIGTEVFTIIKRIFIVSDELNRLSAEVKILSSNTQDHAIRIAVIENTLSIAQRASSKLILPGK